MAESTEQMGSGIDIVKLGVAALVIIAAIAGFYHFAEQPQLYRVLGLLVLVIAAAGIALTTAKGQALTGFMRTSRTEVRKMVWPTRAETIQTTGVVVVVVLLVGVFLWLLDMLLGWLMQLVIG